MKLASVTAIYQDERFIRPHFNMIKALDENIVLVGTKDFPDYVEAGRTLKIKDKGEEILRKEFPHVHIHYHDYEEFCGNIFNKGLEVARQLGCDAIIKLDPDMLLTKESWDMMIREIKNTHDWDTMLLPYQTHTMAYKMDFEHGVPAYIFPVGSDPHVIRTNQHFINDGHKIKASGRQKMMAWENFMVHHFTGFKSNVNEDEIRRVERLSGFPGWETCPQEIQNMFI